MRALWWLTVFPVAAVAIVALELLRRRRERLQGPYLVQQIQDWHKAEPVIKPLDLPAVKPLHAERSGWGSRFSRHRRQA